MATGTLTDSALSNVNRIQVAPTTTPRDVRREIVGALHREVQVNARAIRVSVNGQTVVLTGTVDSWAERDAAERFAMHATGIAHVENLIVVAAFVPPKVDNARTISAEPSRSERLALCMAGQSATS